MSIEIGLFMGLCMWVSFKLGARVEKTRAQNLMGNLLSKMNEDMDGEVDKWFEKLSNANLIKGGE